MHFTLCDMFSDLTQNAIEAGARVIMVNLEETPERLTFSVRDNGKGMSPEKLHQATDPFYTDGIKHPGRKIGLGIPFLIQTAESTGGTWNIRSETAESAIGAKCEAGTIVDCSFDLTNIDTPPVGDVTGYFRQVLSFDGDYEMIISRTKKSAKDIQIEYTVSRSELLEALGLSEEGSFVDASSLALLATYLNSMEE